MLPTLICTAAAQLSLSPRIAAVNLPATANEKAWRKAAKVSKLNAVATLYGSTAGSVLPRLGLTAQYWPARDVVSRLLYPGTGSRQPLPTDCVDQLPMAMIRAGLRGQHNNPGPGGCSTIRPARWSRVSSRTRTAVWERSRMEGLSVDSQSHRPSLSSPRRRPHPQPSQVDSQCILHTRAYAVKRVQHISHYIVYTVFRYRLRKN